MAQTLAQLVPWIIAGAFLPTWTSYVTLLLGTERPPRTSLAYVLGNAAWRLLLGFAVLFIVSAAAPQTQSEGLTMPPWAAWTLAAILWGMGFWLITRKPNAESAQPDQLPKWLQSLKRLPPWAAFGYAVYNCALPGAQWVYFLGGTGVIVASGLPPTEQFALLVVFVALLETMLLTPIVIYYRRREKAKATFEKMDVWLGRHASTVFGGILVMIGAFFAWIALNGGHIGGGG
jgi:hypothetical protein